MLSRLFYGPPDWLVDHTNAHQRRAVGFWTFTASLIGACFFGGFVWYVTIISLVALIPNFSAETPVEEE